MVVTLAFSLIVLLARTGGTGAESRTPPAEISYAQTWPKGYDATTCGEFLHDMDEQQRFAAGADLLVSERLKGDSVGMPSGELVGAYVSRLRDACPIAPGMKLAEASTALYATERDTFRR